MSVDEESQKRGCVFISYHAGIGPDIVSKRWTFYLNTFFAYGTRLVDSVPIRILSTHICLEEVELGILKELFLLCLGRDLRVRLRVHDGTSETTREERRTTLDTPFLTSCSFL
jgi:hypothetical protein